ncbi:MAG: acyltransferase [Pseudobdellovibrio sp.]|nr:acyltransferase [Pseudobdellovibrio sp.]
MGKYIRQTVQSGFFNFRLKRMNFFNELFLNLRAAFRLFRFLIVITMFGLRAMWIRMTTSDPLLQRKRLILNGRNTARLCVKAFRVEVICNNPIPEDECSLLVGNHIGFIDIVSLQAIRDAVFITSLEMKNTPVLGQISEMGGCAYVDRKNRMGIQQELKGLIDVLKQEFRVVLYAESVASNGEQVLPFKKTLMTAAGLAGKPIRPFVFNFAKVNDGPVLYEHRDSLCWYGDNSFFSAIWKSMKLDSVACEIEFLPLIYPGADEDRTTLANRVHAAVSAKYKPFHPSMNLGSLQPNGNFSTV